MRAALGLWGGERQSVDEDGAEEEASMEERGGARNAADMEREIIDAGWGLFDAMGYDAVSVKRICDEAGVSANGFYRLFSSKEELLARAFWEKFCYRLFCAQMTACVRYPDDNRRQLEAWLEAPGEFARAHSRALIARCTGISQQKSMQYERLERFSVAILRRWREAGFLRGDVGEAEAWKRVFAVQYALMQKPDMQNGSDRIQDMFS